MSGTIERLQALGGSTAKAGIAEILRLDEIISRYAGTINAMRAEIERLRLDTKRLDYADDRLARENAFRYRDATQPSTLRGIIDERMAKDPDANKLPGI